MEAQVYSLRVRLHTLSCALRPPISINTEELLKGFRRVSPRKTLRIAQVLSKTVLFQRSLEGDYPIRELRVRSYTAECSENHQERRSGCGKRTVAGKLYRKHLGNKQKIQYQSVN